MRIEVDRERCEGVGMCEAMASDVFELDDDEVAVQACPVLALTLID